MNPFVRLLVFLLVTGLLLGACGVSETTTTASSSATDTDPNTAPPTAVLTDVPAAEPTVVRIGAKCGPSPHAMPLFVALAQHNGGQFSNGQIEFVPVTEPTQMTALLHNAQVDAMIGFITETANIFQKGEVSNLRLISVPLWRAFYVVGTKEITGWADLQGEVILMPDPQGGPSQLARASMQQAGFDPETDFEIQNLQAAQIIQMMIAGQARAAVVSEPFSTMLLNKSRMEGSNPLAILPIDLTNVYTAASAWPDDTLPIEAFLALQETLDDPARLALLQEFEAAYYAAINFMQANPEEASQLIATQLSAHCDSNIQPQALVASISSGRMLFNPYAAADLLPDLDTYIEQITGQTIDDTFYAPKATSVAPGTPFPTAAEEASTLIAAQVAEQCDGTVQPMAIQKALEIGRLIYGPAQAADLLPDLDSYIEIVLGQAVDDVFYAQP